MIDSLFSWLLRHLFLNLLIFFPVFLAVSMLVQLSFLLTPICAQWNKENVDSHFTPYVSQKSAASKEKKSGFLGAAGWVFIGLLVCVLCVLVVVAAVFGARRRHANAQKLQNKNRPNSFSANAQFSSASQGSQSRPRSVLSCYPDYIPASAW